ncbi:hypothetical protein J4207_04100 [Candidatus Woesearchaeota archaeon]|nr:hypothetical protein [Candidatus Woesearchaeota archaeon]
MKLLILDCNEFAYTLDHKTAAGEEIIESQKVGSYKNPLVVFVTIEEKDTEQTLSPVAKELRRIAQKNNVKHVILNPFAHLSSQLASPPKAIELLDFFAKKLKECNDFRTERSVFGWYKQFTIDVKGHEYSQIFREY